MSFRTRTRRCALPPFFDRTLGHNSSDDVSVPRWHQCAKVGLRGSTERSGHIIRARPRENGYRESFNSKLHDELLNGEIYYSLAETRIVTEACRQHYSNWRPHSSHGCRPPAPRAVQWPAWSRSPASRPIRPWRQDPLCTQIETGPSHGGRPSGIIAHPTQELEPPTNPSRFRPYLGRGAAYRLLAWYRDLAPSPQPVVDSA